MIQQTYRPAAIVGPVVRTVVSLGKQIYRVKALGVNLPWWTNIVIPWSVTSSRPLIVTVPADAVGYYGFHAAQEYFLTSDNPNIVAVRNAIAKTAELGPYVALAFDVGQDDLLEALGRYLEDSTAVSADGQIVVTVPQMWFVDP